MATKSLYKHTPMKVIEIRGVEYVIVAFSRIWLDVIAKIIVYADYTDYDYLFRYSTATEEDFEKVVDEPQEGYYLNYRGDNFVCISAAQSFRQLLISLSLDPNKDYIILKKK